MDISQQVNVRWMMNLRRCPIKLKGWKHLKDGVDPPSKAPESCSLCPGCNRICSFAGKRDRWLSYFELLSPRAFRIVIGKTQRPGFSSLRIPLRLVSPLRSQQIIQEPIPQLLEQTRLVQLLHRYPHYLRRCRLHLGCQIIRIKIHGMVVHNL